MWLFGNREPGPAGRDFARGPVTSQSKLASPVPDVHAVAKSAIADAHRASVDAARVLAAIDRVLGAQMDTYAAALPSIDLQAVRRMRAELGGRPDFRHEMYFHALTYFGSGGVAMANGLAEQLTVFVPELVLLIRTGHFDHTRPGGQDEHA